MFVNSQSEGVRPYQCGYDRPSPKFLNFLDKHFALRKFVPQTHGFVVFQQYFLKGTIFVPCYSCKYKYRRATILVVVFDV